MPRYKLHKHRPAPTRNVDVEAVLEKLGIKFQPSKDGKLEELDALCPHKEHNENRPSWHIHSERGDRRNGLFHCWSCISASEEVWTPSGLISHGNLEVGDSILQIDGTIGQVVRKQLSEKLCAVLNLDLVRNDGLKLTPDHICMAVKKEDAFASLSYLWSDPNRPKGRFLSKAKSRRSISHSSGDAPIVEAQAGDLRDGDYLLFPVIEDRSDWVLEPDEVVSDYTSGPKTERIEWLPCTEEVMYLCGLYLAEGSTYRGVVEWTFRLSEKRTLAASVVRILRDSFGLEARVKAVPEHSSCKVRCCKTDLVALLEHSFGKHSWGKHLPPGCFGWSPEIQKALIRGWADGDGSSGRHSQIVTASKALAHGMLGLAIQAGLIPSVTRREARRTPDGLEHREYWTMSFRGRESLDGFFETIGGTRYLWLRITGVEPSSKQTVVDIEVQPSSTFVTRMGAVHNCKWSGNIFHLVMYVKGCSFPEASRFVDVCRRTVQFDTERQLTSEDYERGLKAAEPAALKVIEWKGRKYLCQLVQAGTLASDYLASRCIGPRYVDKYGLMDWREAGRVIAPITRKGSMISWVARSYLGQMPKVLTPERAPKRWELFGLDFLDYSNKEVNLCEGWVDVIRLDQARLSNPLGLCGSKLTEPQVEMLTQFKFESITLWMDGDRAGRALAGDIAAWLGRGRRLRVVPFPDKTDPGDFSPSEVAAMLPRDWSTYRKEM